MRPASIRDVETQDMPQKEYTMRDDRYSHFDEWESRERSPTRSESMATLAPSTAAARMMPHNRNRTRRASDEVAMPRRGTPATAARVNRRRSMPSREEQDHAENNQEEEEPVHQQQDDEVENEFEVPTQSQPPTQAATAARTDQIPDVVRMELNFLRQSENELKKMLRQNQVDRESLLDRISQVQRERRNFIHRYCPRQ